MKLVRKRTTALNAVLLEETNPPEQGLKFHLVIEVPEITIMNNLQPGIMDFIKQKKGNKAL